MKKLFLLLMLISINVVFPQSNKDSLSSKLLELTNAKQMYNNSISMMLIEYKSYFGRNLDVLNNFIWKYFNWDSVKDDYISMYSEEFTAEDLKGLIDFYKSPLGQKLIVNTPIILEKIMRISSERFNKKLPVLDSLFETEYTAFLRDTTTNFPNAPDPKNFIKEFYSDTLADTLKDANFNCDDCKKFREGKFIVKNDTGGSYIIRNDKYQHEIFPYMNSDAEYKINWVSNCEYNLTFIKDKNRKFVIFKPGEKINIKINGGIKL